MAIAVFSYASILQSMALDNSKLGSSSLVGKTHGNCEPDDQKVAGSNHLGQDT